MDVELADARLLPRFWAKVRPEDRGWSSDCWVWQATCDQNGYAMFGIAASRSRRAHIVAYEALVAPVPSGLQLDHLCRVRPCVHPLHLEPVTLQENIRRGMQGVLKTHCVQGHERTPENTYWRPDGSRECKVCKDWRNLSINRPCRQREKASR